MAYGTVGMLMEQLLSFWGTRRLNMGEPQLLEGAPEERAGEEIPQFCLFTLLLALNHTYTEQPETTLLRADSLI